MDYSIHYHVWDCSSFMDFLVQARNYLGRSFEVVHFERNHDEAIAILIKRSP